MEPLALSRLIRAHAEALWALEGRLGFENQIRIQVAVETLQRIADSLADDQHETLPPPPP